MQVAALVLLASVTLGSTNGRYGHADTVVDATPDRVRDVMTDFGHYRELHPKFGTARVIAKDGDTTDVYLRVPVKLGAITIWQYEIMRFGPARALPGGGWTVEGRGIKGDMKEGHIVLSVKPGAADTRGATSGARLSVDVLLAPSFPAPKSLVDEELRDAAVDLAGGLSARATRCD